MIAIVAPVETACGTISRSKQQTAWAVQKARYRIARDPLLTALTDDDIVWLLIMGWRP